MGRREIPEESQHEKGEHRHLKDMKLVNYELLLFLLPRAAYTIAVGPWLIDMFRQTHLLANARLYSLDSCST